jgi:hypothetical protein
MRKTGISALSATIPYIIFSSLFRVGLLLAILVLAYGWYIVRRDLPGVQLIPGALAAVCYAAFDGASKYVFTGWMEVIGGLLGIAVLGGYLRCVQGAVRSSSEFIVAHMLIIQKSGIAPKTTPVYQKYLMLRRSFKIIAAFCVLLLLSLIAGIALKTYVWPPMCAAGIAEFIVCAALAWMMSLRRERNKNYYLLEEDADGDVQEVARNELENIDPELADLERGGRVYEDGMALPRPPRIRAPPQHVSELTITQPLSQPAL